MVFAGSSATTLVNCKVLSAGMSAKCFVTPGRWNVGCLSGRVVSDGNPATWFAIRVCAEPQPAGAILTEDCSFRVLWRRTDKAGPAKHMVTSIAKMQARPSNLCSAFNINLPRLLAVQSYLIKLFETLNSNETDIKIPGLCLELTYQCQLLTVSC